MLPAPPSLLFIGTKSLKPFTKQLLISLICTFAFTVALAPATYGVDGCSSAGFKVASTVVLEAPPFGVASGDFNSDGHLDVVVVPNNVIINEVIVLYGRGGTERFGPPTNFPVGGFAQAVTVGDLNGDSKPDLAVTLDGFSQPLGRISILLNDGTGRFGPPSIVTMQGNPSGPVFGDVNNDGKLDMVAGLSTGTTDGRVAVLLGDGAGGFSQAPGSPFSTLSRNSSGLVIGDFNEDGKLDLAVPGNFSGVDILSGDGTGQFAARVNVNTNFSHLFLAVGNFNGDGHLDLLCDNRMILGTGTGSFSAPIVIDLPPIIRASLPGDVNNDGHLDVVAPSVTGLTIMLGNGTGNLARGKSYASGINAFGGLSSFGAFGDFNEDGKIDIAAVQPLGFAILEGDGAGAFNDALSYRTSIPSMRDLVAADFNNDGKQDFAIIGPGFQGQIPGGGGTVEVALGDGSGGFTRKSISNFGLAIPTAITSADFNNDGKLDLAVTQPSNGRVSILLNDGTGGFPTDTSSVPFAFVGFQPSALKPADVNNDSKIDLIVIRANTNSYVVMLALGGGAFTDIGGAQLQGTNSFNDDLAIGDFNADGKPDMAVVRSDTSIVNVLSGNGTSQFSNYATVPVPGTPISVVVRDLSGDGKDDIAVSSSNLVNNIRQPFITVLINNGAQGFNPPTSYPTEGAGILGVGDFNGDSKPDLAVSSGAIFVGSNLDGIAVLTNKGNGEFNASVDFSAGPISDHLAVADFNNDGKDDVIVSQSPGSVALLLNNFTTAQQCLSVNDVTITETDTGTIDAVFTITLSAASAQAVKVNYFASPAFIFSLTPATKGADYENVPGTVTFAPGETTKTISIPVKGDLIDEFDQVFFVTLTTPINAAVSDGKGLGTIVDNDAPPSISINDVAAAEGTGLSGQSATFTVSLSAASEKPVTVDFSMTAGTATQGVDYFGFSSSVEFPAGTVSKTINVSLIQDNVFEPDETFFVNLTNATNATIADAQGQGTISNDDPQPGIAIAGFASPQEGTGTTNNASFEVRLSNPSHQTITVAFATADGTATAGADYTATSGTITFNPGETSKFITVALIGDSTDEVNETFVVNLSNATNATITGAQGVATILDDDGPTMSIDSVSIAEGHSGFTNAVFTVTLSAPSVQNVFVNVFTLDNTAISGFDYQRLFGFPVSILAGQTSATVTVRVFGDFQVEPDENFTVQLQFPSNATIANGTGTGTIVNDDSSGKLQFSSQTYSATEDAGSIDITVSRVDGATGSVTVDYATSNGTATAGSDYTAASGMLTFLQGEISKTFSIPITNDNVFEPDETVNLTLSNPTGGATLGTPATATLTIQPPPLILVLDESGPGSHQATALDSLLLMRDPFPVISTFNLFHPSLDRNTRVTIFVANLQLAPGDVASSVKVNLFDSSGQSHDVDAEDMRILPVANFTQVTFRLPDSLRTGICVIKVRGPHNQESNTGTIRIRD